MKKILNTVLFVLFIICFSISCFTFSSDNFDGYFGYHSTKILFIKLTVLFFSVIIITILNRNNSLKVSIYNTVFLNFVLIFIIIDMLFTHISGTLFYFRAWWLAAIYLTESGLYLGAALGRFNDFDTFTKKFWKSVLPTYIFVFVLVFARVPSNNLTTNFSLGHGTFKMLEFIINNNGNADSEIFYIVIGNIIFFIPIAFLLKTAIPKIKYYQILIIGIIIPFVVEGYQYIFKCGDVDIDDIVFNAAGFLIGFILCIIENKYTQKKRLSK